MSFEWLRSCGICTTSWPRGDTACLTDLALTSWIIRVKVFRRLTTWMYDGTSSSCVPRVNAFLSVWLGLLALSRTSIVCLIGLVLPEQYYLQDTFRNATSRSRTSKRGVPGLLLSGFGIMNISIIDLCNGSDHHELYKQKFLRAIAVGPATE
ncbi:hypothetical protein BDZ89DRAFT_41424 [Hymenopellis radicata]|nr:hypothetical protein BDZ89DRAFT_41424 [Hymenopellis radicata]